MKGTCVNEENSFGITKGATYEVEETNNEHLQNYFQVRNDNNSIGIYKKHRFYIIKEDKAIS